MKKASTAKKKKVISEEQLLKRQKATFKRKIRNIFTSAGFEYIPINNHEMTIGRRKVEVDALFIYKNIWLLCEDTAKTSNFREHIRTKNEAFGEIKNNLSEFRTKLTDIFPDKEEIINAFNDSRILVFGLYISKNEIPLLADDPELFEHLIFVQPQTLDYFQWIVKCIKLSARNEIFRFLQIKSNQLDIVKSAEGDARITAPIIYPKEFTGMEKVRIVSFMMSAEDLLDTCYVLRKDNWEDSIWLYQRLIEPQKIKSIREFVEKNGEAFYNNIIVSLPDSVRFQDASDEHNSKSIDELCGLEEGCKLILPKEINSICIIDGQHRIYAHYESGIDSRQERKIAMLRKQLHLLVTGLIFPHDMKPEERYQIQSKIFRDINSNAKPVPPNVLLQIKRILDPIDDESIAQLVIEKLNKEGLFKNMFQISTLDGGRIKTASIIRFALRYLVTVSPAEGKQSLFDYWSGDKQAVKDINDAAIQDYAAFCAGVLRMYFGAIKKNMQDDWKSETSKLLSVISINGFIIALTRQLDIDGVRDFDYYDEKFREWNYDFSKEKFPFTSSQYRKFSTEILRGAFGITQEAVKTI